MAKSVRPDIPLEIMRLHFEGLKGVEIARRVGCSGAFVSYTINGRDGRAFRIPSLPGAEMAWLTMECRAQNIEPPAMARKMLLNAIQEAKALTKAKDSK